MGTCHYEGVRPDGVFTGGWTDDPTGIVAEGHRDGWRWLRVYRNDLLVGRMATMR